MTGLPHILNYQNSMTFKGLSRHRLPQIRKQKFETRIKVNCCYNTECFIVRAGAFLQEFKRKNTLQISSWARCVGEGQVAQKLQLNSPALSNLQKYNYLRLFSARPSSNTEHSFAFEFACNRMCAFPQETHADGDFNFYSSTNI